MMNRFIFKTMSVFAAVLLTVSACSSSAATPTISSANPTAPAASVPTISAPVPTTPPVAAPTDVPAPKPQVTTVVSQATNAIDACSLVTKDEASQAVGAPLKDGVKNAKEYSAFAQGFGLGSATISSCTYLGQAAAQYVNVFVFQFAGAANDLAQQQFKAEMSQNPKVTLLSGLGDLAYGMPATVIVQKGSVIFAINVIASPKDLAAGKYDMAQALATIALARLP